MPQMAPINWLILFMYFLSMLYLIMNFLYFNFIKNKEVKLYKKNSMKNYKKFI